jgi:glycosyltransferase involved in cell wall biosynthesis
VRVLLGAGWYFPDAVGGTETYIRSLAAWLAAGGIDVAIAAPRDDGVPERYAHEGVRVLRYPVSRRPSGEEVAGIGLPAGFGEWERILREVRPDIVHFHSFTRGLGLPHMRAAKANGAGIVLTVHLPSLICPRGTMLRFGRVPCDGDLARQPCAACRLHGRGIPRSLAAAASRAPAWMADAVAALGAQGRLVTALSGRRVQARHRRRLAEVFACADRVVAVSRWLADSLRSNGLPPEKLSVCPQGVEPAGSVAPRPRGQQLRVGFIGRYDPMKGLHVLVRAMRRLPAGLELECHVWGSGDSPSARTYRQRVERLARGDARIRFHPTAADARSALGMVDLLVVPSVCMETGPLVVLEALAAGVPVVGSGIGGIAERVRNGVDGLLVPPGSVRVLRDVLASLASDPSRLDALRAAMPRVRTMETVARETLGLYRELLAWEPSPAELVTANARAGQP